MYCRPSCLLRDKRKVLVAILWPSLTQKCARCHDKEIRDDLYVSGDNFCPSCTALTPEQKLQLSVPSYKKWKKRKIDKVDKSDKSDKFVDPPSVSIIGPASDDQVEHSQGILLLRFPPLHWIIQKHSRTLMTFLLLDSPDPAKKVSSKEACFDSSAFHPLQGPSLTGSFGLDPSLQGTQQPPVFYPVPIHTSAWLHDQVPEPESSVPVLPVLLVRLATCS